MFVCRKNKIYILCITDIVIIKFEVFNYVVYHILKISIDFSFGLFGTKNKKKTTTKQKITIYVHTCVEKIVDTTNQLKTMCKIYWLHHKYVYNEMCYF